MASPEGKAVFHRLLAARLQEQLHKKRQCDRVKNDACHVSGPDTAEPSDTSSAWMKPANEKLWEHDAPKTVGARQ